MTIEGLTISNGFAQGGGSASAGAGIYNDHSVLTVSDCVLSGNLSAASGRYGGAIYNGGDSGNATLTVVNSTLSGNSTSNGFGGGISNNGTFGGSATLTVVNSTLSGN